MATDNAVKAILRFIVVSSSVADTVYRVSLPTRITASCREDDSRNLTGASPAEYIFVKVEGVPALGAQPDNDLLELVDMENLIDRGRVAGPLGFSNRRRRTHPPDSAPTENAAAD
jgi:hypothetical protein